MLQFGTFLEYIIPVFHRILDLNTGWISIRPFSFLLLCISFYVELVGINPDKDKKKRNQYRTENNTDKTKNIHPYNYTEHRYQWMYITEFFLQARNGKYYQHFRLPQGQTAAQSALELSRPEQTIKQRVEHMPLLRLQLVEVQ